MEEGLHVGEIHVGRGEMEEGLQVGEIGQPVIGKLTAVVFVEELKRISYLAFPILVVSVAQYLVRASTMSIVGNLGELELASTSLATSIANVTGYSVLLGMSTGLETLCGQAFGAKQYKKIGTYALSAIITLLLTCLPISLLWTFIDKPLILMGQDPLIAVEARRYTVWLIPSLLPYSVLQPQLRYLMSQSLVFPMLWSSVISLLFHIPTCWALVFRFKLGTVGAALAIGLTFTLNAILLGLYANYSLACLKSRISFSRDAFPGIWEFLHLGIPSAAMMCLAWWSSEIIILLSGILPNPALETSVLSISLSITNLHYYIPYGFGSAACTRIANELGAGNAEAAKLVFWTTIVPVIGEAIIATMILFSCRSVLGYAFGNVKEVIDYVKEITPLICIYVFVESICIIFVGVVKGTGRQKIGAYINMGAFYLVGIPMALVLGFVVHWQGKGLYIGPILGLSTQCTALAILTFLTNWPKEVTKARERMLARTMPQGDQESMEIAS